MQAVEEPAQAGLFGIGAARDGNETGPLPGAGGRRPVADVVAGRAPGARHHQARRGIAAHGRPGIARCRVRGAGREPGDTARQDRAGGGAMDHAALLIAIFLAFATASAAFGQTIFSTPFENSADTFSASTSQGSGKERRNEP